MTTNVREWSTNGVTYSNSGICCVSVGLAHAWVFMGETAGNAYYVCDGCGCWSRKRR